MVKSNNRSFTLEDFKKRIRNELQPKYAACFTLLFLTGMRISECLPLTRNNITITSDDFAIVETITLKRKGHPIKNVLINLKNKHNKTLFYKYVYSHICDFNSNPDVRMFDMSRLMVNKHAKQVGFQTVHNLRRSFINNMAAMGATEFDVVSMLNLRDSKVIHTSYANKFGMHAMKKRLRELGA